MVVCDAKYCFPMFDLCQFGSSNDGDIMARSETGNTFKNKKLRIPEVFEFEEFGELSYYILGDEISLINDNARYATNSFGDSKYSDGSIKEGESYYGASCFESINPVFGSRYCKDALTIRKILKCYVNSENGSLPLAVRLCNKNCLLNQIRHYFQYFTESLS